MTNSHVEPSPRVDWRDQTPHLIHVALTGDEFRPVEYRATCPHDGRGPDRWCKWGHEAPGCLWEPFEEAEHHPSCTALDCDDIEVVLPWSDTGATWTVPACWRDEPVPEECDGFYNPELGHCHAAEGMCALIEAVGIGFGEAVHWAIDRGNAVVVDGPVPVRVAWSDGCMEVEPLPTPTCPACESDDLSWGHVGEEVALGCDRCSEDVAVVSLTTLLASLPPSILRLP